MEPLASNRSNINVTTKPKVLKPSLGLTLKPLQGKTLKNLGHLLTVFSINSEKAVSVNMQRLKIELWNLNISNISC